MIRKSKLFKRVSLRYRDKANHIISPKGYSPREQLQNCIWIFTIGDADDKPSVPHAHAKDVGYRLDAWTGDIYPAGNERKQTIGKLKRKELKKLHSDTDFLTFAKKQIEWYKSANPHISFYVPEWFILKSQQLRLIKLKQANEGNTFIFIGKASIKS